ncbi:MAG: hypothetical protein EOP51_27245 [Sphingobacteriales bacterium]|nr:MAG: hypothetical protein EOP51_27245 [Sphingobacteriales bacterium]
MIVLPFNCSNIAVIITKIVPMKIYLPLLSALLYIFPATAQVPGATIDVQHYTFNLVLNDDNNNIIGKADINIKALKNADAVELDLVEKNDSGKGMEIVSVYEGDKKLRFEHIGETLKLNTPIKQNSDHTYTITYNGTPADGLIISTNKFGDRTFFGDNWLKRAHHWLPCVDDVADKAGVDFIVTAPAHYGIVSNGLKLKETITGKTRQAHWSETVPISTKLMVIGVADFAVDTAGMVDGIPVYSYIFKKDKADGFKSYAAAKDILAFYSNKIGPYAYKKLANVQSKTVWGGMENASVIFYYENSVGGTGVVKALPPF